MPDREIAPEVPKRLRNAVDAYLDGVEEYQRANQQSQTLSYSYIEILKLAIADAFLFHYGLPINPTVAGRVQFEGPATRPSRQSIPWAIRWKVFARDDYRCRRCPSREFLTIDHIRPRSLGGTDDMDNLQTLCRWCNSSKGART